MSSSSKPVVVLRVERNAASVEYISLACGSYRLAYKCFKQSLTPPRTDLFETMYSSGITWHAVPAMDTKLWLNQKPRLLPLTVIRVPPSIVPDDG